MAKIDRKQFVIIGLGRFGSAVTRNLSNEGMEVLAIDSNSELVNNIQPYCTQAVCADATDERVLEKLAINNYDVAIVCIGDDVESSIFITLMCKRLGVPYVISKAQNEKHKHVLEKVGADKVIIPEEEMGQKLAMQLSRPNMVEILSLSDKFRMIEIKAPAKWHNKSLITLDLRKTEKVSILLIKRGEDVIVSPGGDFEILPDDIVVLAGSINDTQRLSNKATEKINDI